MNVFQDILEAKKLGELEHLVELWVISKLSGKQIDGMEVLDTDPGERCFIQRLVKCCASFEMKQWKVQKSAEFERGR